MRGWLVAATAMLILLAAAAVLGPAFGLAPGNRQPATLDEQVREVASQLRCLQCQGLSAWESNTQSSLEMRAEIRRMLEQGLSRQEIVDYYVERYGTWVLITPPFWGFGALAYVVPATGLVLGVFVLRRLVRAGLAAPGGRGLAAPGGRPAAGASRPPAGPAAADTAAGPASTDASTAAGSPASGRGGPSLVDEALRRYQGYDR